jgi:hypothetical protein
LRHMPWRIIRYLGAGAVGDKYKLLVLWQLVRPRFKNGTGKCEYFASNFGRVMWRMRIAIGGGKIDSCAVVRLKISLRVSVGLSCSKINSCYLEFL